MNRWSRVNRKHRSLHKKRHTTHHWKKQSQHSLVADRASAIAAQNRAEINRFRADSVRFLNRFGGIPYTLPSRQSS